MSDNVHMLGNDFDYDPIKVIENLKDAIGVGSILLVGYCHETDGTVVLSSEQVDSCLHMLNKGIDNLIEENTTFDTE